MNHRKRTCLFIKRKDNFQSRAKFYKGVDINCLSIYDSVASGRYGQVYVGKIGPLEFAVKFIAFQEIKSFEQEKKSNEIIHDVGINDKFPKYFGSLQVKGGNLLIFEKLDFSFSDLTRTGGLCVEDYFPIFRMMICKLKNLHQKGICHRDLKGNNMMFCKKTLYLIDYGCSRLFDPSNLPKSESNGSVFGSLRFMSLNSHRFVIQMPRDDLENLGYMFASLLVPSLDWDFIYQNYKDGLISTTEAMKEIKKIKEKCTFDTLPLPIQQYISYVRKLKIHEIPNYDYLIQLFGNDEISTKRWISLTKNLTIKQRLHKRGVNVKEFNFCKFLEDDEVKSETREFHFIPKFDEFLLPLSFIKGFSQHQWLSKTEIVDQLLKRGIKYPRDFRSIDVEFDSERLDTILEMSECKLFLIHFRESWIRQHFAVYIYNRGKLVSFNGLDSFKLQLKTTVEVKSTTWDRQLDDWSCGYRAYYWIDQICSMGVEKWLYEIENQHFQKT